MGTHQNKYVEELHNGNVRNLQMHSTGSRAKQSCISTAQLIIQHCISEEYNIVLFVPNKTWQLILIDEW